MAAQNGGPLTLLPPSDRVPGTKDKLLLVFQLTWLILMVIPSILVSLFRKIVPPSGKSLKNKVVLVTGAGRGLGRGLAQEFARVGAKVVVVDVDTTSAIQTAQEIVDAGGEAKAYTTNIAKTEEISQLHRWVVDDLGKVDVLVNNAGLIYGETIEGMTEADVRAVIEVNLLSHFWMTKEFLPAMRQRNSGHIVAICSASAIAGLANGTAYSSSKSGVMGFMDALREELRSDPKNNIKTTTVFPYFINTSANYMNAWDLRKPALSIEEVTKATVSAVRRDETILTVPGHLYFCIHLFKVFPQKIGDKIREIFYSRIILPPKEEREKSPTQNIINEL